jgi:hypothetical protein
MKIEIEGDRATVTLSDGTSFVISEGTKGELYVRLRDPFGSAIAVIPEVSNAVTVRDANK